MWSTGRSGLRSPPPFSYRPQSAHNHKLCNAIRLFLSLHSSRPSQTGHGSSACRSSLHWKKFRLNCDGNTVMSSIKITYTVCTIINNSNLNGLSTQEIKQKKISYECLNSQSWFLTQILMLGNEAWRNVHRRLDRKTTERKQVNDLSL